jgi:hypothetical protein
MESREATVRTLRDQLGEERFEAVRAEGRGLALDDAVADAFELLRARS